MARPSKPLLRRGEHAVRHGTQMATILLECWAHDSFSSIGFSQLVRSAPAMLVDGAVGLVWAPVGRLSRVLRFTITRGKIVQVEIIADPARLRDLDLAVIKE
jgi:hypothetical protein